ncbi:hypothetical protein ACOTCB_23620 [Achromobacter xylosoxidans]
MEPGSGVAAGAGAGAAAAAAALKVAAAHGAFAALAALLGLLILPPRTRREFVVRTVSTVICSFAFGPAVAAAVLAWFPALTESLAWLAHNIGGDDEFLAKMYVLGPCSLLAGLPAWWVLGGYMRWMARIKEIGLMAWIDELMACLPWGRHDRKE